MTAFRITVKYRDGRETEVVVKDFSDIEELSKNSGVVSVTINNNPAVTPCSTWRDELVVK